MLTNECIYEPREYREGTPKEDMVKGNFQNSTKGKCSCNCKDSPNTVACMVTSKANHLQSCCKQDDHVVLQCGHILPIMSAACRDHKHLGMPVMTGRIGDTKVSVLRDSGCSGIVVRRSLISDDQLTGEHRVCVLIDGTVRKVPVANVNVNTPFFTGKVEALCMQKPVYDVILGNVTGVREPSDPDPDWREEPEVRTERVNQAECIPESTLAVQTRAQKRRESKPRQHLKVPTTSVTDIITPKELQDEQQKDDSLKRCRELATEGHKKVTTSGKTTNYFIHKGIMYREFQSPKVEHNHIFHQVVVPLRFRSQVMKLAHESLLGGHQCVQKTTDRVMTSFFWPGIHVIYASVPFQRVE